MNRCTEPKVGRLIHDYEIGHLSESDRDLFEQHLIVCTHCMDQVSSFDPVASLIRSDSEVKQAVARAARTELSLSQTLKALWRMVWPESSLALKPAFIYAVLALMIYPAYLGIRGGGDEKTGQLPTIWLTSSRTVTEAVELEHYPLVIIFHIPGAQTGAHYQISILDERERVSYNVERFTNFAEHQMATLLLPGGLLSAGSYNLIVEDSTGANLIREYQFQIK